MKKLVAILFAAALVTSGFAMTPPANSGDKNNPAAGGSESGPTSDAPAAAVDNTSGTHEKTKKLKRVKKVKKQAPPAA